MKRDAFGRAEGDPNFDADRFNRPKGNVNWGADPPYDGWDYNVDPDADWKPE